MLIPLRHEHMRGRRWPIITFTLIGLNILIFLFTHGTMEEQHEQGTQVCMHLLILAANHPELQTTPDAAEFIEAVKKSAGKQWDILASPHRSPMDTWDAQIRELNDPDNLQQQMTELCGQYEALKNNSVLQKYAYIPAQPRLLNYVTANFLHGGWMHLIGNMWFLWLAGFILEDNWGRLIYTIFYFIAGAVALQFYAWCTPGSFVPLLGASGAVAALMGAFLVRFPKLKIEMATFVSFYPIKFKVAAYWLLPFWVGMEFLYGSAFGNSSGVAHWAHVGGFLFGMLGALVISKSGLEQKASSAIESKISWTGEPELERVTDILAQGKVDEAASALQSYVASKTPSVDALTLLQQVQWRRNDIPAFRQASVQLCQANLKAQNLDGAWKAYEEYTSNGGDALPASSWLELNRMLEAHEDFARAVDEYQRLAAAYPAQRESILALLSAGRLCLKKLNRPDDALRNYKAANSSPIPHLDWDSNIQAGIRDAEQALRSVSVGTPK